MIITCFQSDLIKSLNISMRAVPSRTTMPILECILVDAQASVIRFITNDMELGIETIVEGKILEKGIGAINARMFNDIIRKLPNGEVKISIDEKCTVKISCEKSNFTIPGKTGEDFPYLPAVDKINYCTLSQFVLREMIRQTVFSIAANDNNSNTPVTGELFEIKDNILSTISLDGHRISIRRMPLVKDYLNIKVIIPGKSLVELSKILSGEIEDTVNLYFTTNHILFEFDQTIIVSRLINGEYFPIEQMLSIGYETKVSINRKQFVDSLDRSTLLLKEGDKKPLILRIEDTRLNMSLNSSYGSMSEDLDIQKEGKDILIAFNPRFLLDVLRTIDEDEVKIYFVNSKAPCFIRDDEQKYTYVILPININPNQYN